VVALVEFGSRNLHFLDTRTGEVWGLEAQDADPVAILDWSLDGCEVAVRTSNGDILIVGLNGQVSSVFFDQSEIRFSEEGSLSAGTPSPSAEWAFFKVGEGDFVYDH